MEPCANLCLRSSLVIILKGNQAEEYRLRSWFKLVDSTFDIPLYASDDWRYIAPMWREQSSMQPFVREVREKFHHHRHMLRDPTTKRQACQNQHCTAVERLYYATHYQFKVDAQAFDLVMEFPRYLHISREDKDWLVIQHPRIEPFPAAVVPKEPGANPRSFVTVVPSFVRMVSLATNFPSLWQPLSPRLTTNFPR